MTCRNLHPSKLQVAHSYHTSYRPQYTVYGLNSFCLNALKFHIINVTTPLPNSFHIALKQLFQNHLFLFITFLVSPNMPISRFSGRIVLTIVSFKTEPIINWNVMFHKSWGIVGLTSLLTWSHCVWLFPWNHFLTSAIFTLC